MISKQDAEYLRNLLRAEVPRDTSNLYYNGFPFPQVKSGGYVMVVGGPVAPYAPNIKMKGTKGRVDNPWAINACRKWANEMKNKYSK